MKVTPGVSTIFHGEVTASFNFDGPFALSSRYSEGRSKLDLSTPLNFVSTQ
jgi:hypothetical protein